MTNRRLLATWPGLLIAGVGCSLWVDAEREQCATDGDCENLGQAFAGSACVDSLCQLRPDPNWDCLNDEPAPAPAAVGSIRLIVPMVDVVSRQPKGGVPVRACDPLDFECTMPLVTAESDANGEVDVRLPAGFTGYLSWQAADVYPTLYFFGAPLERDTIFPVEVVAPPVFAAVNEMYMAEMIEGRAPVIVFVRNCLGGPAEGVRLSVPEGDEATRAFYMVDGLFPPGATETAEAGRARLINVPLGTVSIEGKLADGREIGTASVLTKPGYATLANLSPPR